MRNCKTCEKLTEFTKNKCLICLTEYCNKCNINFKFNNKNNCESCFNKDKEYTNNKKLNQIQCKSIKKDGKKCTQQVKLNEDYCGAHLKLQDNLIVFDNNIHIQQKCAGCKNILGIFMKDNDTFKTCIKCRFRKSDKKNKDLKNKEIINNKEENIENKQIIKVINQDNSLKICKAISESNNKCIYQVKIDNHIYCKKHYVLQWKLDNPNTLHCSKKGCIIEPYIDENNKTKTKCKKHFFQSKQNDEQRKLKNKEKINNIKDKDEDEEKYKFICNNIKCSKGFNIQNGKSNKCEKCYLAQQNVEKNRPDRDRKEEFKKYEAKPETKKIRNTWKLNNYDKVISYWQKSRNKRRSEDLVGYLKKQAENAKNWRKNSSELYKLSCAKSKLSNVQRLSTYKKSAEKRNIEWNLTDEEAFELFNTEFCFYCTEEEPNKTMGIDRIDNEKEYIKDNVIPCCSICNNMKNCLDIDIFIEKCRYINNYKNNKITSDISYFLFPNCIGGNFNSYIYSANKRNIEFNLIETDFNNIINNQCYLCGKNNTTFHLNGIDRIDNNIRYVIDNCKACCTECNYIKKDYSLDLIYNKCNLITNNKILNEFNIEIDENIQNYIDNNKGILNFDLNRNSMKTRQKRLKKQLILGDEEYKKQMAEKKQEYRLQNNKSIKSIKSIKSNKIIIKKNNVKIDIIDTKDNFIINPVGRPSKNYTIEEKREINRLKKQRQRANAKANTKIIE
jgi:hypothetical protein